MSCTPLQAFNTGYGFTTISKYELAKISKKLQPEVKQSVHLFNLLKFCSYVPILSTIMYAIILANLKNMGFPKKAHDAFKARAVISLIPGLGLALLPVDLFATAITHPIALQNERNAEGWKKFHEENTKAQQRQEVPAPRAQEEQASGSVW